MKTSKYLKTIAFCALMLAAAMPGKAQVFPNTYINIDWQVGVPLGAGFADKASGWGMNFEGGYFTTATSVSVLSVEVTVNPKVDCPSTKNFTFDEVSVPVMYTASL